MENKPKKPTQQLEEVCLSLPSISMFSHSDPAYVEAGSLLTQQGHQPHDCEDWLSQELHMGWASIVDLEAGSKCALGERVRVVAQEGIVIAQEHVAHGGTAISKQQVLVLCNDLWTSGQMRRVPEATCTVPTSTARGRLPEAG